MPATLGYSTSALAQTGPCQVASYSQGNSRTAFLKKSSTSRALVLRNGRSGSRGTGEVILPRKLCGREKFDLLAEDIAERLKNTVMSPFRLDQCLKIAESQLNSHVDDISSLRDSQLFMHLVLTEVIARAPGNPDPLKNPKILASVVATKIHNTYMLASAWKLVLEILCDLEERGVTDGTIKKLLKFDLNIRSRFLVLHELVETLVNINHAKFSVLATTAPHYTRYFKKEETTNSTEPLVVFDWTALRDACVSFLDSIVIELCFPQAPYPKVLLLQVLRDAVGESPKDAVRFPQALWDAVGDLSVAVHLQQLLEAPLSSPEVQCWKTAREMPKEFEDWNDAQFYSELACNKSENFANIIFPLIKTKRQSVLDDAWEHININYKSVCGKDMDTTWSLIDVLEPSPRWHELAWDSSYFLATKRNPSLNSSSSPNMDRKFLMSEHRCVERTDDLIPGLDVSNSSDLEDSDDDEVSDDNDVAKNFHDTASDSGYDTEAEEEMAEWWNVAKNVANAENAKGDTDLLTLHNHEGNPFINHLKSLRGRMFSPNPRLKTAIRSENLNSETDQSIPLAVSASSSRAPLRIALVAISELHESDKLKTAEEVRIKEPSARKKKSIKRRVRTTTCQRQLLTKYLSSSESDPSKSATSSITPDHPESETRNRISASTSFGSTSSLPISIESNAQSARSYLQAENLYGLKTKVKSRPSHPDCLSVSERKEEAGSFSKILGRERKVKNKEDSQGSKRSWFARLGKKTRGFMHQLLNTKESDTKGITPMKWENFVKIMKDMGFQCNLSTAGSSVRFDPEDKRNKPITFHKPHPDPTIQPIMLKRFAKRLRESYGWDAGDLQQI